MNRQTLAALVVLNVVLLIALVVVGPSPEPAMAQGFGQQQYMMVAGRAAGRIDQNAVYIIETTTGRVVALFVYSAENRVEQVGPGRDMRQDLAR